jgi:hypothetical protein
MKCENCPNPARITLYKDFGGVQQKIDTCTAHAEVMKHYGFSEKVLDEWNMNYEKLPTENIFKKWVVKIKRNK